MADERLYEFPSKSTPTPADIVYLGDAADSFNEVNSTIEEIISAYPNLIGMADLVMGNETFPYKNAIGVWSAGAINTFGVDIIGTINTTTNAVLATDGSGAPDLVDTLPSQVQANITELGTQIEALDMGSNLINNVTDPASPQDAATKKYVDDIAQSRSYKDPCNAATTGALTVTYNNGASGVGATLTNAGALAAFSVDGYSASVNDRILVKNQASTFQNGIYVVTTVGSGAVAWVLTRSTDMDIASQFLYGTTYILSGSTQNGQTFTETATVVTIGTDPVTFILSGDSTAVTSVATGTGLTGGTITSTGTISLAAAADQTLKGNVSGGSAAPIDLTKSQVLTMLGSPINQINTQTITATGAFSYTPTTGTKYAIFEFVGGGGGGGGTTGAGGQQACAGAGGAGSYFKILVTGSSNLAAITGSVGGGGSAGASGNNSGGNGSATTLTINGGTQWVAAGGLGGAGQASSTNVQSGGASGASVANTVGTNATVIENVQGEPGRSGFTNGGSFAGVPGVGGSSKLGVGGVSNQAGIGNGGGGGGYNNFSGANSVGFAGGGGLVIVTEFISA